MTKLNNRRSILEILQSRLDNKYGRGIFKAAKILLLFGCMSVFTSCVSDGRAYSTNEGGNIPSTTEGTNTPRGTTAGSGAKIIIERTGQTANPELPFDTDEPFVIDAFFAKKLETKSSDKSDEKKTEEKPRYKEIKEANIGETVYVFVDTINLNGKKVDISILDKEGHLTKGVKMDKVPFKDSNKGVFSGTVGDDDFAVFEVCLRHKEKDADGDLTQEWKKICKKQKTQFAIKVEVIGVENVIYCGLNDNKDEEANIWLNQEGLWFKINEIVTIVIDPGHGGKDPGVPAYKGTRHEKDIVLIVGLLLKKKLMDKYSIIMTRETDIYVGGATATQKESLRERVRIAKINEADVFISIHVDSAAYEDDKGKVHYNENADHAIVFSAKSSNAESTILKNNIAVSLSEVVVPLQNVRQEEKGYGVLNGHVSKTGAVLVEIGFITNKAQEDLMNEESNTYLTSIANKLAEGIINTIQR